MKKFDFVYEDFNWTKINGDPIPEYEVRLALVYDYLNGLSDSEIEELNQNYLDKLGEYVLFAYDKSCLFKKENITTAQYKVLVDNENGLKTHVDKTQRQKMMDKRNDLVRTEENEKRLYKNIESLFIADDMIKAYQELINKLSENNVHGKTQSIREDIYEVKKAFVTSEVKSKNEVNLKYETLANLDIEYTEETIKILLRSIGELQNSEPYTDAHCIYLDLKMAIERCKFTKSQREALLDYMNGFSTKDINMINVELAVKKILKFLQ